MRPMHEYDVTLKMLLRGSAETALRRPRFSFSYELIDLRSLDGEPLLVSEQVGDNNDSDASARPERRDS